VEVSIGAAEIEGAGAHPLRMMTALRIKIKNRFTGRDSIIHLWA
jgi:hypothetical protein